MDPATLAVAAALSIGGKLWGGSEASGQANAIARARMAVLDDYMKRTKALYDESRGYFGDALGGFAPASQAAKLGDAQAAREATVTGNMSAPTTEGISLPDSTPDVVNKTIAGRLLNQFNLATNAGRAKARLGGYGDWTQGNSLDLTDKSRRVGTVNNAVQGETNILPSLQDLAQIRAGAQNSPSIWPQLMQAAGSLAAGYAGSGGSIFGGTAAPGASFATTQMSPSTWIPAPVYKPGIFG
jgi:hypothetical protein